MGRRPVQGEGDRSPNAVTAEDIEGADRGANTGAQPTGEGVRKAAPLRPDEWAFSFGIPGGQQARPRLRVDAWDSAPPRQRTARQPDGPATYRVRFGWACRNGDVHLARLELAIRAGPSALQVPGEPTVCEVCDSRLGADRWDRLLIDAFAANRLLGYLMRRREIATA